MKIRLHARTRSALPIATVAALTVTALLLFAALPAMAQAQDATPTPTPTPTATSTPEPPTPTPEPPTPTPTPTATSTPEPPTPTPEPPTATPEPPAPTPEPPTATPEPPTATPEPPTATPEPPTATPEPPTATPEAPTATPEAPTATPEAPTATPEAPTATPEAPTATPEAPTATPEAPTATPEAPTATPEAPTATPEAPTPAPDEDNQAAVTCGSADSPPSCSSITNVENDSPELSFSQVAWSADETDADGTLTITVKINPALAEASAVNITAAPNAAADARVPTTLALPAGQTVVDLSITINGDDDAEGDESFDVELSAIPNAPYTVGAPAKTTITIIDDDHQAAVTCGSADSPPSCSSITEVESDRPELSFSQAAWSADETDADGALTITVKINPALAEASAVNITTSPTAAGDADVPATLALPAGQTSVGLSITIKGDDDVEGDESFDVELSASDAAPYTVGEPAKTTITIIDDDRADAQTQESAPAPEETPTPEAPTPTPEAPTPTPGSQNQESAPAADDDNQAAVTCGSADSPPSCSSITEVEDNSPELSFSQVAWSAEETDADGTLTITVNINPALAEASAVNITTRHISTAAGDADVPATLALPAGQTSVGLSITISGDDDVEADESFEVELSAIPDAPYTVGAAATATITIIDDDRPELTIVEAPSAQGAAAAPQKQAESPANAPQSQSDSQGATPQNQQDGGATLAFKLAAYTVNEADGALDITVNIAPALPAASTVNITTSHISSAAADVSVPATLTLPQGATSATLRIPITADTDVEGSETFTVALSAVADAPYELIQPATATITIVDDDRATLAFAQAAWSVNEADGALNVTVNIAPALPAASAVTITTSFETASAADVSVPATLTLPQGATSATLRIPITADTDTESAETFTVALSAVADALYELGAPATATITINDDNRPTLAFSQAAYSVNEADGGLSVTVNFSRALPAESPIRVAPVYGSATAADGGEAAKWVSLSKNMMGWSFTVPITDDELVEGAESFRIALTAADNASYRLVEPATTTITIVDDDRATLTLAQAAWTVNEADGALDVSVNIAPALPVTSTVNITTQHISSAAADVSVPATLTLPQGATSATLRIPVTADTEIEGNELFKVALSAIADAPYELGLPSAAFITILDDTRPVLTFEQAAYTVNEADGTVRVVVNISPSMPGGSTILLTPEFGPSHTAASADINSIAPKLITLSSHVSSVAVLIPVTDDTELEGDETFAIALSGGPDTVYRLGSPSTATVTIVDNDLPILSFLQSATFVNEKEPVTFTLSVSRPLQSARTIPVTLLWVWPESTDRVRQTIDFTLAKGATSAISPPLQQSQDYDNHETRNVSLVASDGALYEVGEPSATTLTIFDRDRPTQLTFANAAYSVDESDADGTLNISVNIIPPLTSDSTVNITTRYNGAASAADVSVPATLTLPKDAHSVTLPITIRGDDANEGAESFAIELSAVADAPYTLGAAATTTITINDDDHTTVTLGNVADSADETAGQSLDLGEADYTVYETVGALTIPVHINPALPVTSTVNITTRYDSASAADVSVPATLTLPKGATSATLRIPITADTDTEGSETFTIALSAVADAPYTLGAQTTATITIKDDNRPTLAFSQAAYTVNEADGSLQVTVNINPRLQSMSSFNVAPVYDTATAADVVLAARTVTLDRRTIRYTFTVPITDDDLVEGAESFKITLTASADASYRLVEPSTTTITIVDDDTPKLTLDQAAYTVYETVGALTIPVNIAPAMETASVVTIVTRYDTASAADVSVPATLTLPQGATSATLRVPITADTDSEGAESFEIALSAVADAPYTLGEQATATITINDDNRPTLAFSQAAYTVDEADGGLSVTVNFSRALAAESPIRVAPVYGSATAADGGEAAKWVSLSKNMMGWSFTVPITDDELVEGAESFKIALTAGANASYRLVEPATATITINDDDLPKLAFSQAAWSVNEANSSLDVSVNISSALPVTSTVNITTRYDSASTADVSVPATLTLPKDATSATLRIPITADNLVEGAENVEIALSAVADAPYELGAQATATITITDNDHADLSITSARQDTVTETDEDFTYNITLNIAPQMEITSTVNIAVEWNNGSMVRAPATLTLPKGATSVTLPITIIGDNIIESSRRVRVRLSAVADAPYRLSGLTATQGVTILLKDDDGSRPALSLSQAAYTVNETDGDVTKNITVNLNLTLYSGNTVNITTRHISTSPADVTVPTTFTLPVNHQGRTIPGSYAFPITIHGDEHVEGAESFEIELSAAAGARYQLAQPVKATITISDDEFATLTLGQAAYSVDETAGELTIPVNISPAMETASVVTITTSYGSATAADVSVPATLTLPKGATSATLRIPITADTNIESEETFTVALSAVEDAPYRLGEPAAATITINEEEIPALSLGQAAYSVYETAGELAIPVNISPALPAASTVNITTRYGTATAADVSVPATLTLPQGATSATLRIPISADTNAESDETFTVALSAVADAPYELGEPAAATITIREDNRPTLAFEYAAYSVNEADGRLQLTVKINPALPAGITLNLAPVYDSATAADVSVPTTHYMGEGTIGSMIFVPITDDDLLEGVESFKIALTASADASFRLVEPATATITIVDDDTPTLTFEQAAYSVNEADGTLDVTVKISPAMETASAVNITTRHISSAAADATVPMTLTLPKGATSATLQIPITADTKVEGDETFRVALSAVADAPYMLGEQAAATITINDDDFATLAFSQAAYTATETDTDGTLTLNVTIAPAMETASAVNITTRYNGAASAADVSVPTTLTLPAGQTSVALPITIRGDALVEGAESFEIELSASAGAPYVLGRQATTTITINDDDRTTLAFGQAAYTVSEAGGALDVTVNISPAMETASAVTITTRYDSATAADISAPTALTLPKDATSATLRIPITADTDIEGDETFTVALSAVEDAPYELGAPATATITIVDDDTPTLAFSQAAWSVTEADTDGALNVNVNISPAMETASTVNITTRHISTAAADVSAPTTLTLPKDATSVTIPITIRGDALVEGAESFAIELSAIEDAPYKLGAPATATITINDDDRATVALGNADDTVDETAQQRVDLGEPDYTVNEADGALTIPVNISPALPITSSVNITTRYDSATADDVSAPTTLTLPQGATSATLRIPITADTDIEGDETFTIALSAVADAPYELGQPAAATITINDDDFATLTLGQAAYTVNETDGALNVTVNISPTMATASAVTITTRYDSASAADVSVPATLTLPQGATSATLRIPITDDSAIEGAESFEIELGAVADAPYRLGAPAAATITINDDDRATLAFSQAAYTVNETDGALNVTVNVSPAMAAASAVNITTRYASASAADVSVPATLTLPRGETSATLRVPITADSLVEGDETFTVALSAAANAPYTLGAPATATITIKDSAQASAAPQVGSNSAWTITVTPGDRKLDVSWQAPPRVNVGDISTYLVSWCIEDEEMGCSPTARTVIPAADGSGSYTITYHFSPGSDLRMVPLINGARYRVWVSAIQGHFTSLARSEFSYNNRPQASGDNPEN